MEGRVARSSPALNRTALSRTTPTVVRAWRPRVTGIAEVLHAQFVDHAYPLHTHDTWTLLIVDDGAVRYELGRREHGALQSLVTLLPPHVPHDGRAAGPEGFRKRVLYLDAAVLEPAGAGRAVDQPGLPDPLLRRRLHQLHEVLTGPDEPLEAEGRFVLIAERLRQHLRRKVVATPSTRDPRLARLLRELLDARVPDGLSLGDAATLLDAHPTTLVRAFSREYGIPPHRYLTGRRIDLARRHLLDGRRPAEVAALSGFCDQAHLTRAFGQMLGTTPGQYVQRSMQQPGSTGRAVR